MSQPDQSRNREPLFFTLEGSNEDFFLVTYMTSSLTASFGLAKALKTGPCKILPEGGLLSSRFLLLILASLLTLIGKWVLILTLYSQFEIATNNLGVTTFLTFAVVLLPGLIIALISTWHSKMLRTFLIHPSFFILPMFTFFTFSSSNKACGRREGSADGHIRFSVKASQCNTFLSFLMGSVIYLAICASMVVKVVDVVFFIIFWIPAVLGFLLSLFFLCNAKPTNTHFDCCCCGSTSMCCSCEAYMEYSVFKPDQPTKEFLLRIAVDGSEEVLPVAEREEEGELEVELKEQMQEESR